MTGLLDETRARHAPRDGKRRGRGVLKSCGRGERGTRRAWGYAAETNKAQLPPRGSHPGLGSRGLLRSAEANICERIPRFEAKDFTETRPRCEGEAKEGKGGERGGEEHRSATDEMATTAKGEHGLKEQRKEPHRKVAQSLAHFEDARDALRRTTTS